MSLDEKFPLQTRLAYSLLSDEDEELVKEAREGMLLALKNLKSSIAKDHLHRVDIIEELRSMINIYSI